MDLDVSDPCRSPSLYQTVAQFFEVRSEIHALNVVRPPETLVYHADGHDAAGGFIEVRLQLLTAGLPCLKVEHGVDELETVLDPVIDLLHKKVFLYEKRLLVGQRSSKLYVQFSQPLLLQKSKQGSSQPARCIRLGGGPRPGLIVNNLLQIANDLRGVSVPTSAPSSAAL